MKIKTAEILNDGMTLEGAEHLFDQIEKFAAYSFNLSHSVSYSILSYQSMWLKQRYPAEFYAASLTKRNA
jgi:DNA polymerase-3 subunit alpha